MTLLVRRFRGEDLEQILAIEQACFSHPYGEDVFNYLWKTSSEGFLVACIEEGLVGYIVFSVQGEEGVIYSIAIHPAAKSKGYGDELLSHALRQISENASRVRLQVAVDNNPAVQLYLKHGFCRQAVIKAYYEDGKDAYLMTKKL